MIINKNIKNAPQRWGAFFVLVMIVLALDVMPAAAQSNDVSNRLNRLENEIDTLNRAVYRGETPPAPAPRAMNAGNAGAGTIVNGEVRLQQLEQDIRTLTGKVEEQGFAQDQLRRQVTRLEQTLADLTNAQSVSAPRADGGVNTNSAVNSNTSQFATPQAMRDAPANLSDNSLERFETSVAGTSVIEAAPIEAPTPNTDSSNTSTLGGGTGDATAQYEQAFAALKADDFDAAQRGFDAFLANHAGHSLESNAKYWLGETYYVRGDFETAARVFAEGYRAFPISQKAPDNLLKLGLSLAGMGKTPDACIALAQLPVKHKDAAGNVLKRGVSERKRLGCE